MKKKLLKRLTSIAVAVAMTVTMVTGFSVSVYASPYGGCTQSGEINLKVTGDSWIDQNGDGRMWRCCDARNIWLSTQESGVLKIYVDEETGYWEPKNQETGDYRCDVCGATVQWPYTPTPTPTPEPKKEDVKEDKEEPKKEKDVDRDTFKSEEPYGTAGVTNTNSKIGDLKVHKVNAITETNQKFLADAFAKQHGKKARILTTVSVHPRRALGVDNGKKEALIYANLEKNPQTVYAVCYNQTDKAYYLSGTLDKDGVATFPDFILRDATNITIFVLE